MSLSASHLGPPPSYQGAKGKGAMSKARYIPFYPDEFLAGISGQMTPEQIGAYWTICSLIYSRGKSIKNDPKWIGNLMGGTHWRTAERLIRELHDMGKIDASGPQLGVQRCRNELARAAQKASKNSANGAQGGRPSNKINDLEKRTVSKKKRQPEPEPELEPEDKDKSLSVAAKAAPKKRGARLPVNFEAPEEWFEWGREQGYSDSLMSRELAKMIDWSQNSDKGAKKDWLAAWRNWLRNNNPDLRTTSGASQKIKSMSKNQLAG